MTHSKRYIDLSLRLNLDEDVMAEYPAVSVSDIADSLNIFRPYLEDDYHISVRPSGFPSDVHFVSSLQIVDVSSLQIVDLSSPCDSSSDHDE